MFGWKLKLAMIEEEKIKKKKSVGWNWKGVKWQGRKGISEAYEMGGEYSWGDPSEGEFGVGGSNK